MFKISMTMKKEDLKIVFLGTPEFAVESLSRLYEGGYNIVGVITMPDKPAGRGHKLLQSPVKQYALAHGLHLMQPTNLKNQEFVDELRSLDADLFIVIAFRMLWSMPRLGTFNLHASLLPKYRGAAPINWAVINGDKETGVTTFFLKHDIDTGDIIDQKKVEIRDDENVGDIHDKLMSLGAELTMETVAKILDDTLTTTPQDELTKGVEPTPAPKIFKDTCHIDWNNDALKIHNLIRGLSPYPAAWTTLTAVDGKELQLKVFAGTPADNLTVPTGKFKIDGDKLYAGCAGNVAYEITELQLEGKRRMSASDFLRGINPLLYTSFI